MRKNFTSDNKFIDYLIVSFLFFTFWATASLGLEPNPILLAKRGVAELISDTEKGSKPSLKNPQLVDEYLKDSGLFYTFGEHIITNSAMGLIVGVLQGGLIGLYGFKLSPLKPNSLFLTGGVLGGVGLLAGAGTAILEHYYGEQFTIGPNIMKYTVYGTLGGAFFGVAVGGIFYASNNNLDDLINSAGYGALGGIFLGSVAYVLFEIFDFSLSSSLNMDVGYDLLRKKYSLKLSRPISF